MLHTYRQRDDQAATLRRLFAKRQVQLLPVWIGPACGPGAVTWLARLVRAFASQGERTLVVDASRLYLAAALGLRARFDLLHALAGECSLNRLVVSAGADLWVVPALRALDRAAELKNNMGTSEQPLTWALPRLADHCGCDRILLLFSVAHAPQIPAGCDCVVPVSRAGACHLAAGIEQLDTRLDIADFRLLFLDMESKLATTLAERLRSLAGRVGPRLLEGGCMTAEHDLVRVTRAASGWRSALLTKDAMERWV